MSTALSQIEFSRSFNGSSVNPTTLRKCLSGLADVGYVLDLSVAAVSRRLSSTNLLPHAAFAKLKQLFEKATPEFLNAVEGGICAAQVHFREPRPPKPLICYGSDSGFEFGRQWLFCA